MKLKITKDFAFAHRGCDVVQYLAGTEVETDDQELIETALAEKWAVKPRAAREPKVGETQEDPALPADGQPDTLDQVGLDLPSAAA